MRNLLWRAGALEESNALGKTMPALTAHRGGAMKLFVAICAGFAASIVTATVVGFFIGMAFPHTGNMPALYAAEFAGIVISLTVWFFLARRIYRRLKSKDPHYAERLA